MNKSFILYALIFIFVSVFLFKGLYYDPKKIQSPLIGKNFPLFELPDLYSNTLLSNSSFLDKKTIVNVWASWCLECEREHSYLIQLSKNKDIDLVGINYKDESNDAVGWLSMRGNPYRIIIKDSMGDLALDLGVYGVPETYILDENQIIQFKHIGPIDTQIIQEKMLPLLRK
tara:strand:+ start:965 stop:1480 length:516 start_codon:yes stop_codon:yes gene_type:complete